MREVSYKGYLSFDSIYMQVEGRQIYRNSNHTIAWIWEAGSSGKLLLVGMVSLTGVRKLMLN